MGHDPDLTLSTVLLVLAACLSAWVGLSRLWVSAQASDQFEKGLNTRLRAIERALGIGEPK